MKAISSFNNYVNSLIKYSLCLRLLLIYIWLTATQQYLNPCISFFSCTLIAYPTTLNYLLVGKIHIAHLFV